MLRHLCLDMLCMHRHTFSQTILHFLEPVFLRIEVLFRKKRGGYPTCIFVGVVIVRFVKTVSVQLRRVQARRVTCNWETLQY